MPTCCVPSCFNTNKRGIKLYQMPVGDRNAKRREIWVNLISRSNLPNTAKICEIHFSDQQFEKNRQDGKKRLRPDAIPDLIQITNMVEPNTSSKDKQGKDTLNCDENMEEVASSSNGNSESDDYLNFSTSDFDVADCEALFNEVPDDTKNVLIEKLRKSLRNALRRCSYYRKRLEKRNSTKLEQIFSDDQLKYLETGTCRGASWSDGSIQKGLRLYMACGTSGYEEIRKQGLPYPSIRTLQSRLSDLKFKPGILDEVFGVLKLKMETLKPSEKHATLIFDEMSITPGLQLDSSLSRVIGRPTLQSSHQNSNEYATHALVYMLAGVSTRWKQIVAYDFTGNSYNPLEAYERLKGIIMKAHEIGITVRAIVSDMGPQNRSLWKLLNIVAGKHSVISNSIPHPCLSNERLLVVPDPVHIYKNIAAALTKGYNFVLGDSIVKKHKLQYNIVSIEPIKELYDLEKHDVVKLCPHLKEKVIRPSHFDKMNVSLSTALLSHDVAVGLLYYISLKKINEKHTTTAWFLQLFHKWFRLLTCRYPSLAMSMKNKENYDDKIMCLKSVQDVTYNMTINNKWLPFQSGILLATESALDFQKIYLEEENFDFIMLGRLTQDCLENTFSSIRSRQSVPDAHMFKVSLRLVCLGQFESHSKSTSYENDEGNLIIKYCSQLKENKELVSIETTVVHELQEEDELFSSLNLSSAVQASLYYLLGAVLHKIKKHYAICDNCYKAVQEVPDEDTVLTRFTKLREYKANILVYPTLSLYDCIFNMELSFRAHENDILENRLSLDEFISNAVNTFMRPETIPNCHCIFEKTVKLFFKCRVYFLLNNKHKKPNCDISTQSSRSMAMRASVNK